MANGYARPFPFPLPLLSLSPANNALTHPQRKPHHRPHLHRRHLRPRLFLQSEGGEPNVRFRIYQTPIPLRPGARSWAHGLRVESDKQ